MLLQCYLHINAGIKNIKHIHWDICWWHMVILPVWCYVYILTHGSFCMRWHSFLTISSIGHRHTSHPNCVMLTKICDWAHLNLLFICYYLFPLRTCCFMTCWMNNGDYNYWMINQQSKTIKLVNQYEDSPILLLW